MNERSMTGGYPRWVFCYLIDAAGWSIVGYSSGLYLNNFAGRIRRMLVIYAFIAIMEGFKRVLNPFVVFGL